MEVEQGKPQALCNQNNPAISDALTCGLPCALSVHIDQVRKGNTSNCQRQDIITLKNGKSKIHIADSVFSSFCIC